MTGSPATPDGSSASPALLAARGVCKSFGHVEALRGVDFEVRENEVVALVGDNGAGKSTLIKVLAGVLEADEGVVEFDRQPVSHDSALAARDRGIETVYQDLALAEELDPVANLFLGREILRPGLLGRLGVLDKSAMRRSALSALADLGLSLPSLRGRVAMLSGGQRQGVAVARAASWASRVVFMDEPTAALGVVQTSRVLEMIRRVKEQGISVVLISHNLPDVMRVADRVEVMRLGRRVAQFHAGDISDRDIVAAITGAVDHAGVEENLESRRSN